MTFGRTLFLALNFFIFSLVNHNAMAATQVMNAYVNAPPPVMKMTAGFLDIYNDSEKKITLVKLSSPIASKVEIHETTESNGMMKMRKLDFLDIPPHSQVSLAPGGKHLMLHGLKQRLEPGQSISLTLEFANQASTTIEAKIRDIRKAHDDDNDHHDH